MAVLILIAMLALGAYSLSYLMSTEAWAVQNRGRRLQARMAAESGIEYVKAYLLELKLQGELGTAPLDDPAVFEPLPLSFSTTTDADTPYFVCVAPEESGSSLSQLRYGITDEAARPNLNVLATQWYTSAAGEEATSEQPPSEEDQTEERESTTEDSAERPENPLLYLETLTPEVADAILDWIDRDQEPRTDGAETDYYQGLNPPYAPRDGRIATLTELLLVRGVTPQILFGEDADFDGVLDWNENDGAAAYPMDDANGYLDRGLYGFLTLYTVEPNLDAFGQKRLDLNQDDLEALYDALAAEFGEDLARFVVAYRLFGPAEADGAAQEPDAQAAPAQEAETGGAPSGPEGDESRQETEQQAPDDGQDEQRELVGLDASGGPRFRIESIAQLIDAEVNARLAERDPDGQPRTERLESPLTIETLDELLPELLDRTTTQADTERFEGLINVNTASRESLLMVPGMSESLVDLILSGRPAGAELGGSATEAGMAWLLSAGVLSPQEFQRFERYLTGRSFVYRVHAIGFFPGNATQARIEAVIDVSGSLPRVRWWAELSRYGRGIDARSLLESGTLAVR